MREAREVDSMENADVQKMFQVNALLASMPANDSHREMLVQALHAMKMQFISENMMKEPEEEMSIDKALCILGHACQIASAFEAKALGEEAAKSNASERSIALNFLVDSLNNMSKENGKTIQ